MKSEQQQADFLSRWSARKHAVRKDEPVDDLPAGALAEPSADNAVLAAETPQPAPPLTDADMPPLESLSDDSDFTGFLSPGVSEVLQKAALRKLFHSACFGHCDGLDDYAEDFTSFEKLGDIITSDMRHQAEEALKRLQEATEAEPEQQLADAPADDGDSPAVTDETAMNEQPDEIDDSEAEV